MVSGQKKRLQEDGFDLDMTYITPRIIAMSYPASDSIQQIYRNRAATVANFLDKRHDDKYWVINLSEQGYQPAQIQLFKNRYTHFSDWVDHHGPRLFTLVEACQKMYEHLSSHEEAVIVVHCNGGKGRTGTLICCYMLYCGFADSAQNAIIYYGWKRFNHGWGVT